MLEAIADGELWVWGSNFGHPGSMNDINILDCSIIVEQILKGDLLPSFKYKVKDSIRRMCYYLVHGIYPKWAIFIDTIVNGQTRKHKAFAGAQESVRKDVELASGVLLSRWYILCKPCMFHDKDIAKKVMEVCIILHNMIVELRRDGYESELFAEAEKAIEDGLFINEHGREKDFKWCTKDTTNTGDDVSVTDMEWAKILAVRYTDVTCQLEHFSLKADLVEHQWNLLGSI